MEDITNICRLAAYALTALAQLVTFALALRRWRRKEP